MWKKTFVGYPPDVDEDEIGFLAEEIGVTPRQARAIAYGTTLYHFGQPPIPEKKRRTGKQIGNCTVYDFPARKPTPPDAA